MKKARFIACFLLVVMLLPVLSSCVNLDGIEGKLKAEGYLVRRYDEGGIVKLHEDLSSRLEATGPEGEVLTVLLFKEKEKAQEYYDVFKDAEEYKLVKTIGIHGNMVIFGTRSTYEMVT